jgi:hypothetical protein
MVHTNRIVQGRLEEVSPEVLHILSLLLCGGVPVLVACDGWQAQHRRGGTASQISASV